MFPPYNLNKNNIPAVGIAVNKILKIVFFGNFKFKFGIMIITLKSQYKQLAANVAIPTPLSPIFGIKTTFKIIPIIPDTNFIMNSM